MWLKPGEDRLTLPQEEGKIEKPWPTMVRNILPRRWGKTTPNTVHSKQLCKFPPFLPTPLISPSCSEIGFGPSGPVLRDTARLSQRYPLLRAMGFLVSQHGQLGAIPPPPFLSVSPLESMRSGGAIPPPQKGYLSDTCAIPYENKAKGCDTPLCDTISKGYCAKRGVYLALGR